MLETIEGLAGPEADRLRRLLESREFFWLDVSSSDTGAARLSALVGVESEAAARGKPYFDGHHVAFDWTCFVADAGDRIRPVGVRILVGASFIVTLHDDPAPLRRLLVSGVPEGRSDQYAAYAVLDALVASGFDALGELETALEELQGMSADMRKARGHVGQLRAVNSRLAEMRRDLAPQRSEFDRVAVEIAAAQGGDEPYMERIASSLDRLVEGIDAAASAMATLIELRLNETTYWLTVVATIFLPLTFLTGFFGMNFGWMVDRVDSQLAFWLLGVGTLLVAVLLILRVVLRGSPLQRAVVDRGES